MKLATPLSGKITPRLGWWTWSVAVLPVRGAQLGAGQMPRVCPELLKGEDEFEKKCEMFPTMIAWEDYPTYEGNRWDTVANDYTMDVATILDKKC